MNWLLNIVLYLPAAGSMLLLVIPRNRDGTLRRVALGCTLLTFLLSLILLARFDATSSAMQFESGTLWIISPNIRYHIGVDGISIFLVLLTTFLSVLCILVSWNSVGKHVKEFFFFLLLLETGTLGVFLALDLLLFYVFWEVTLIPMFFLIGIWGHERRIYSAVKFILFSLVGSLFMLVAIIWLHNLFGTFDYPSILEQIASGDYSFSPQEEFWLFLAFFSAFAIKVPLFPLHTWLPDAHAEAPAAVSVMLSGVLLKMGAYGLLRFCLPLFPDAAHALAGPICVLALISIVYGSLVAMVQPDLKKLIAYSSVAHLGFVVLGIFSFNQIAVQGALYQMLNHGISTGALFLLVGMIYERLHTRQISDMGGIATPAPVLAAFFLITTFSSIGLPLLNNFIGEFLILLGVMQVRFLYAAIAATAVVLTAVYMLWMYQRVFLGETAVKPSAMTDLNSREKIILIPAVSLMVLMGVCSPYFLRRMEASTVFLLDHAGRREVLVENSIPKPPGAPVLPATTSQQPLAARQNDDLSAQPPERPWKP